MSTCRVAWIVLVAALLFPDAPRAESHEGQISDDATFNESLRQYRGSSDLEASAWFNPYMPEVSVDYSASANGDAAFVATSDETESADARMAQIVAQYDRSMLDRGGWENPYLPSVSAGNPLLAVAVGSGVTRQLYEEEGAASREPHRDGHPATK